MSKELDEAVELITAIARGADQPWVAVPVVSLAEVMARLEELERVDVLTNNWETKGAES